MDALGLMVMVTLMDAPVQFTALFVYEGVIVYVTVCGSVLLFIKACEIKFPFPFDAPVMLPDVANVQLKVVPLTNEANEILVDAPEQIVCNAGFALTIGVGFTVML